jgi:hypothetical protein
MALARLTKLAIDRPEALRDPLVQSSHNRDGTASPTGLGPEVRLLALRAALRCRSRGQPLSKCHVNAPYARLVGWL